MTINQHLVKPGYPDSVRILICHFHLQTGGVTRVIEHACTALIGAGHRVLVVAGETPQQPLPAGTGFTHLPALAYEERRPSAGPRELAAELDRAARNYFGQLPDVWHFHNHCLGKNLALPGALIILAQRGQRLLLQPHDFAEDGRPALYERLLHRLGDGDADRLARTLYPLAEQVHYAVLNDRDRAYLAAAGVPRSRLHSLPNAVAIPSPPAAGSHPFPGRRLWLYPTRAIRRKNLGEVLLWSALAEDQDLFATTQAPQNPTEQPRYRRWLALGAELALPLEPELGNRTQDFPALLASSHALVTTSVAEGFGLAFLEPWLVGRPLAGRNLREVTRDFSATGIVLDDLYDRLEVPLEWLDAKRLRRTMAEALRGLMSAYGRKGMDVDLERLWGAAVQDQRVDFGRLDEAAQEQVIRHLAAHPADRALLRPQHLGPTDDQAVIKHNRAITRRDYSVAGYGRRLEQIYGALLTAPTTPKLEAADAAALLDRFLAPERLFLLRT